MPDPDLLGFRIREMRRRLGLSQADLAGAELSPSYVSLLEAGKRTPSEDVLRGLARRLNCAPDFLLECLHEDPSASLDLELNFAELALTSGQPQAALEAFEAVTERAQAEGLPGHQARAEWGIGRALENVGRLEAAAHKFDALLRLRPAERGKVSSLAVVVALCRCLRELGDMGRGIEIAERTLTEMKEFKINPTVESVELISTLVGLYAERGDLHTAEYLGQEAIAQAGQLNDRRAVGAAYWNAGLVAHRNGHHDEAAAQVERALAMYAEGDNERAIARLQTAYAAVLLNTEPPQPQVARDLLDQARTSLEQLGGAVDLAYTLTNMARADLQLGDFDAAISHAGSSLEQLGPEHRLQTARTLLVLASAHFRRGDLKEARRTQETAALHMEASGANRQSAFAWAELAESLEATGDTDRALWAYRQSLRQMGHRVLAVAEHADAPTAG
ncbi:helix-turn-helix domain-containing protein [Streptomyces sp. NPDC058751]|uniref:helix-turn-helix domain-containing protein n=1 Tax=Streptomyces sp. NPDC058751 TaxID=3346623 RepID=UPI0036CE6869